MIKVTSVPDFKRPDRWNRSFVIAKSIQHEIDRHGRHTHTVSLDPHNRASHSKTRR
jgi:hypothetical protein